MGRSDSTSKARWVEPLAGSSSSLSWVAASSKEVLEISPSNFFLFGTEGTAKKSTSGLDWTRTSTQRSGSEALSIDGQRQHMVRELCEEPHPTP